MSYFTRASKSRHCPVCGGDHSCSITADGLHFCRRRHQGEAAPGFVYLGETRDGTWGLWRREDDCRRPANPIPPGACDGTTTPAKTAPADRPARQPERPPAWVRGGGWAGLVAKLAGQPHEAQRVRWADHLSVTAESLRDIGAVYCPQEPAYETWQGYTVYDPECLITPERDATGAEIGAAVREWDGTKKQVEGGHRGLVYPLNWRDRPGPIYLPAGMSDTAACLTLGLTAIGRPSDTGGVELMAAMFRDLPLSRELVVVGERDERERRDEKAGATVKLWPGRDDTLRAARQLAQRLGRPIRVVLPPAKDVRAWLNRMVRERGIELEANWAGVELDALGEELGRALEVIEVAKPVTAKPVGLVTTPLPQPAAEAPLPPHDTLQRRAGRLLNGIRSQAPRTQPGQAIGLERFDTPPETEPAPLTPAARAGEAARAARRAAARAASPEAAAKARSAADRADRRARDARRLAEAAARAAARANPAAAKAEADHLDEVAGRWHATATASREAEAAASRARRLAAKVAADPAPDRAAAQDYAERAGRLAEAAATRAEAAAVKAQAAARSVPAPPPAATYRIDRAAERCYHPRAALLSRDRRREMMTGWMRCRCPGDCPGCLAWRRRVQCTHAAEMLMCAYAAGGAAYMLTIPADQWAKTQKAISRRDGEFVVAVTPDGAGLVVVTTAEVPGAARLDDATAACTAAATAIGQAPASDPTGEAKRWQPVRWSAGWREETPAAEGGWTREGTVRHTPAVIPDVLKLHDLKLGYDTLPTGGATVLLRRMGWRIPKSWTDTQIDALVADLLAHDVSEVPGLSDISDIMPMRTTAPNLPRSSLERWDRWFDPTRGAG